jgi:hypothetical protein
MIRFTPALAAVAANALAHGRVTARVTATVRELGWPASVVPQFCAVVDQTMRDLPLVLASTRQGAELSMPIVLPLLIALGTRLDAELPSPAAAMADAMLERTYLGLRVLAFVPHALSPHEFLGMFALHDILGAAVTGRIDSEIARTFPGVTLTPIIAIARELQAQADAMQSTSGTYEHPVYGDVTTEDAVRLEMGRYGLG